MKKAILVVGLLLLVVWGATRFPATGQWVYQATTRVEAMLYGFDKTSVAVGDLTFSLYQRNGTDAKAPTLVLLHGYTASKELWLRFANQLDERYQVLIPDLAGHGETGFDPQWSYRPTAQATRVKRMLDALSVEQAVLIGNSMGGLIAANFAIDHAGQTQALVVIDPAGVRAPIPSRAELLFQQGESPFEIDSWQDFQEFYKLTMAEPPFVPDFVLRGMAERYQQRKAQYVQIAEDFRNLDQLDGRLQQIEVPTLVIWGSVDQLLDASSAEVWQQQLPQSELEIFAGVGHMPMVERPAQTAGRVQEFLKGIE
ncbi:alpha/beta fold hydrolase [Pseudidiomarina terrestris]|uniref:alpha/beta fold hydrolase n=1 Tax=Pseudidiomarina terrestris TaxID=2820060 RepID=UPI002651ADA0|nr:MULTISPECIES: alpha/beta hydrolase [unclassified Pseudidiomarina]MDN7125979.1 alpha/beta hydrolase [Pseudidiomarina sp. 1APR75-33.1]MDN7135936.1 alpha/beta hydrolase [Pseudidiomarina sp. 1ASP75-5]